MPDALAFSSTAGVFRGRYDAHEVKIADGIIDVTPSHVDEVSGIRTTGGTLGLSTTRVAIGASEIGLGAGIAQQVAPNVVHVPRGELVEEITNREDGIEQAWRFADQPLVGGDLTVEVAVSGHDFVAANDSGLHFRSPRGLGFRYSHAIWRDATGASWDIASRFEDGLIRITVPEDVIAKSVYPAVLDPTVTGEIFTDVPAVGTTGASNFAADVTANGTRYLVAWTDQRNGNNDIFASRVATGAVEGESFAIRQAAGVQQNPAVADVGGPVAVVWEDVIAAGNTNIAAGLVAADNSVTQLASPATTSANETAPAIASARAGEALVVWQSGDNIVGARLFEGVFGAPFTIAGGANVEKEPAVSAAPNGDYLVTFTEVAGTNENVRGQRVSGAGALAGAVFDIAAGATAENSSAVAFDGTNHVVVVSVLHSITSFDIAVVRVSPAGALVDAAPVDISRGASGQLFPDIACRGATCFIAWEDMRTYATTLRDVLGASVTTEPAVTVVRNDIVVRSEIRQQQAPAIAALDPQSGDGFLAAWHDTRDLDTTSVRGARLDNAGAVDPAQLTLAVSTSMYQAPALGQTGGFTDYVFAAGGATDVNLMHVRFDGTGRQRDAAPRVVSNAPGAQLNPSATGLGLNAIAVWQDSRGADRDIYAARINMTNGNSLDGNGLQITSGNGEQISPKIASTGTSSLIVWQDRRANSFDILGAVIDANGAVTAIDIPICTAAGDQTRPNLAWDPTDGVYLVVWNDPNGNGVDIRGARVSPAGALLDGACGVVISGAAGSQLGADVTFGAGRFFVAWEDQRNPGNQRDIFGARVSVAGGAIDVVDPAGIAIAAVRGTQSDVSVAFAGYASGAYIAVWTDDRTAATTSTDIRGAQISPNGVVTAQFVVSATDLPERAPDVSAGTSALKPLSVAYLSISPTRGGRVQVRRLDVGTVLGQPCTQDSACESGFCRDYRCCNADCGGGGANGDMGDCQACSVGHYGQADGTCTLIVDTTYICRPYTSQLCDARERCDGVSTTCGPDLGQQQGRVCNSAGDRCPANDVSGAPHACGPQP